MRRDTVQRIVVRGPNWLGDPNWAKIALVMLITPISDKAR